MQQWPHLPNQTGSNLPPIRGIPNPGAPRNNNPGDSRVPPSMSIPTPLNRNGRRDHTQHPGLDIRHLANRDVPQGTGGEESSSSGGQQQQPPPQQQQQQQQQPTICTVGEKNPITGVTPGVKTSTEANEDGEDDDDSDFEIVENPIMTPPDSPSNETEAYAASSLLTGKIPPELVPEILDWAEYFPHEVIAKKEEVESVSNSGSKVYLTAQIPDFKAFEGDTAGKGGAEGMGGRPGRVRRLVFKVASRDQGWSSYPEEQGTFKGSWSWLDVELWRDVPADGFKDDVENDEEGEKVERVVEEGKYKVGTWLLQRNQHATKDQKHHKIVWDWKEDELSDNDEDKWEPGVMESWQRGGRIANGKFVRELKGGDEIRVVMKCLYPGWRCTVESCEVECFWAI